LVASSAEAHCLTITHRISFASRFGHNRRTVCASPCDEKFLKIRFCSHGWNELVLQMERPQVVYTPEWALAAQTAYRDTFKPLVLLGYDGDELVGVCCLATDLSGQKVSFLTATTADYCEFLSTMQQFKIMVMNKRQYRRCIRELRRGSRGHR
jgi:hypothetical protein